MPEISWWWRDPLWQWRRQRAGDMHSFFFLSFFLSEKILGDGDEN